MKYSVDRIEENIAILINLDDESKLEVNINELPSNIHDGSIIVKKEKYELDLEEEKNRKEEIQNRFNNLLKK